jgi:hypothetical protein
VIKDFDLTELAEEFKGKQEDPSWCLHEFMAYLTKSEYLEDIECDHVHIGSYGRIEIT